MSRQLNPSQVWSQVPVASRTVEVNTKTGFSLTAASYAITGSVQRGTLTIASSGSTVTATISSVTITKSMLGWTGTRIASTTFAPRDDSTTLTLTNSTTVTADRNGNGAVTVASEYQVVPFV